MTTSDRFDKWPPAPFDIEVVDVWPPGRLTDAARDAYDALAREGRIRPRKVTRDAAGRVAVGRGPIVYCAEGVDNGEGLHRLLLPKDAPLRCMDSDLLGGMTVIEAEGLRETMDGDGLYLADRNSARESASIRLIPYHRWANRGKNEMLVWLREA